MASAGSGNPTHLAGELFKVMTKVDMTHVPFAEGARRSDLLGGQCRFISAVSVLVIEHIRAGKTARAGGDDPHTL